MKKKVLIIAALVFAATFTVLAVVFASSESGYQPNAPGEPDNTLDLAVYWKDFAESNAGKEVGIQEICDTAKQLCEKYDKIIIPNNAFGNANIMMRFAYQSGDVYNQILNNSSSVVLDFTEKAADIRDEYLVFVASLELGFQDKTYFLDTHGISGANRPTFYEIAYVVNPSQVGMTTAAEVIEAYRAGEISLDDFEAYDVELARGPIITKHGYFELDKYGENNLYYELFGCEKPEKPD